MIHAGPPLELDMDEQQQAKLEAQRKKRERAQAAYLAGRRLLLPGAGVAKHAQRGIELLWQAGILPWTSISKLRSHKALANSLSCVLLHP